MLLTIARKLPLVTAPYYDAYVAMVDAEKAVDQAAYVYNSYFYGNDEALKVLRLAEEALRLAEETLFAIHDNN
jgi:hypothetical protein